MEKYERLRDLREDKDMKQWQIAEILEMKQEQYQRYESGKRETPLHIMIKLAEYYDVSLDYLAGRTNDKGGLHCNYLDQEEKELLSCWKQLSSKQKRSVMEILDNYIEKEPRNEERKSAI